VISVSKARISADAFLREYHSEKQRIKNGAEAPLSDKEMKDVDVKGIVIDNIVNRSVFEQSLRRLGIIIPKKSILSVVQSMPNFHVNNMFNELLYSSVLTKSGIGEATFLSQIKDSLERLQLLQPIVTSYRIPAFIREQIAKEFEAKKTLLVLKLDLSDMVVEENPSNDEVKQYFEVNKDTYKVTERRNLAVLQIDYQALAADALYVNPDDVEAQYQQTKDQYNQEENRDFERFQFENREDADKAWNMINAGEDSDVIKKKFAIQSDVIRGIRLSDLPEQFGKDLFELALNKTSPVCSSGGQFYIYRLIKINAAKMQDADEIKLKIKEEIRNEKLNSPEFYEKIKSIRNKIDDGFGSGKSIDEVAKETGLKVIEFKSFVKDGKEMTDVVKDEATRKELIQASFDVGENQATQIIESKESDSVSYVVYVRKIENSEIPQFEKIIDKVKNDYITHNREKEAETKAREIVGNDDKAAAEVEKQKKVKVYKVSKKDLIEAVHGHGTNVDMKKVLEVIQNPNIVMNIMSMIRKGEATNYKTPDGGQMVVAVQDTDIGVSASDETKKLLANFMEAGASNDIMAITMMALKKPLDIDIDKEAIGTLTQKSDQAGEND
jgi:peptidyl-prolyl cis-trans isomerase D